MSLWSEIKRRNVVRMAILYGVSGWLILQVADLLFDLLGLPDWTLRLVLGILLLGFPVALVFSWLYELTPEGLKREKDIDPAASITQQTGQKLNVVTLVVAGTAIALVVFQQFRTAPMVAPSEAEPPVVAAEVASQPEAPSIDPHTIAVLPFENRSPDPNNAYFADGIHDDLLTSLAKIGDLTVISRTSVLKYRDTEKSIPDIARELSVANVLEGAVQRSGDQVRINVQLIEAETDKHLWAEIFDRQLNTENLFAIQSEIATAIAGALAATLSPEEKARLESTPTDSLAAYEAFLKGRRIIHTRDPGDLAQGVALFEEAVQLDPNYAPALVQLAMAKYLLPQYAGGDQAAARLEANQLLDRALAIDPDLGMAHAVKGLVTEDGEARVRAFERAIKLDPNYPDVYHWYGRRLRLEMEQPERGLEMLRKAAKLDPESAVIRLNLLDAMLDVGQIDEAMNQGIAWVERNPDVAFAHFFMAGLQGRILGDRVAELRHRKAAAEITPESVAGYCHVLTDLGLHESAQSCLDDSPDKGTSRHAMSQRMIALARSDTAAAVASVRQANRIEPGNPRIQLELIEMLLADREYQEASIVAESLFPDLLASGSLPDMETEDAYYWRMVAGRVLQHNGKDEAGKILLEQSLTYFKGKRRLYDYQYEDIMILSCLGRTDEALAALVELVDANWSAGWGYFRESDMVSAIREHPIFKEQMRRIEARMAEQRARAEAEGLI